MKSLSFLFILFISFNITTLYAATKTWDGGGGDNNWQTAANWDLDVAPVAGDALVFAGSTRTSPNNDFAANTNFASITFSAGASAFTLSGNDVTLTGGASAISGSHVALTMSIGNNITFATSAPTITSTSGGTLNITGTITNGGLNTTVACGGTCTFSGVVSGTGTLTKSGSSTLTLSASNTYSGATTVSAGILAVQNHYSSVSYAISSGATLEFYAPSDLYFLTSTTFTGAGTIKKTGAARVTWDAAVATFSLSSGALIDVQAGLFMGGSFGNDVWTSNLCDLNVAAGAEFHGVEANIRVDALSGSGSIGSGFAGAGYVNFTFGVDNGSGTFSGLLIDDGAAGAFVKSGSGTQTLSGASTFTGGMTLSAGQLNINNATALGTGTFTIENGTTIDNTSGGTITMTADNPMIWNGDFTFTGSNSLDMDGGAVSMGSSVRAVTVSASQLTVGGTITGTGGLTKNGTGILRVSGGDGNTTTDRWTGVTTVNAGRLDLGNVGGDKYKSTSWIVNNGGTLKYLSTNVIVNNAILTVNTGGTIDFNGVGDAIGYIAGAGSVLNGAGIIFDTPATGSGSDFSGVASGTGAMVVRAGQSTGTQVFSGLSTYTGATTILGGTLSINTIKNVSAGSSAVGAPTSVANGTISMGNTTATSTLIYTGTGSTTDRVINLAGTTGGPIISQSGTGLLKFTSDFTATGAGAKTLTLTGSSAGTGEIAGAIVNSSSATSVAKTGSGTWTLSGTNTYTGTTTVTAGTLALGAANVIADASNIVMNGGTLNTPYNETAGTLTLSASSTINLSTGNHTVSFAASAAQAWAASTSIQINDWLGGYNGTAAGGSDPKIFVGSGNNVATDLTASQLTKIVFYRASNSQYYGAIQLATGEVVPSGSVLPVTFVSFNAEKQNDAVKLTWETGSEFNSGSFNVMRSTDGESFENIGRIEAAGNSSVLIKYQFVDYLPNVGTNYYKLVEVDRDGVTQESGITTVLFNSVPKFSPFIYATAANDYLVNFDIEEEEANMKLIIYTIDGKGISSSTFINEKGNHKRSIDCSNLSDGIYYLCVSNSKKTYLKAKILKIN